MALQPGPSPSIHFQPAIDPGPNVAERIGNAFAALAQYQQAQTENRQRQQQIDQTGTYYSIQSRIQAYTESKDSREQAMGRELGKLFSDIVQHGSTQSAPPMASTSGH